MSKFKVGDKVKVVSAIHAYSINLGLTGTIRTVPQSGRIYSVDLESGEMDTAYDTDLELVVEAVEVVVPGPSVKAQIVAIEAALVALKTTLGL